jgi:outer membrane protein assembly factor BamA
VEEFQVAPRGFFQIGRRNLFGKDRSLDLFTRASLRPKGTTSREGAPTVPELEDREERFNEYLVQLTYLERRIAATDFDFSISAGVEQAVRSSFDFSRRGASATLTRRLSRAVAISWRYGIDKTRIFTKSNFEAQPDIDRLFPRQRLSSVASSLIRDTRNDALEPTSGSLIGTDAEVAARSLGSDLGFLKTFVQGFTYRQLQGSRGPVLVLGTRVGLGTAFTRTEDGQTIDDAIPLSERFYAGGDSTVRGFALDRLGPLDRNGFPRGGQGLIVLNAEMRIPVRGGLGAVAFIDAGNVSLHVTEFNIAETRGAVGFGLRYRSPVGPIRVDLGMKLDRRQVPPDNELERRTALHISLGQAF